MAQKLCQVLAVEKGLKPKVKSVTDKCRGLFEAAKNFAGRSKTYQAKEEAGDTHPPESQKVQFLAEDILSAAAKQMVKLFDVTATKDYANCNARADVRVNGDTLVEQAPVTYLLFLEKQLNEVRGLVDALPVLDPAQDWSLDENSRLYKTPAVRTSRTVKTAKPIVLYDATEQHPAQTQLVPEDVVAGYWTTVLHSGAVPRPRKEELLSRVDRLLEAVKSAREDANTIEAEQSAIGTKVFEHLFA